ncbi:PEP-CTERM sorting domain-containing protein, partial [Pelomonas sp. HMWF004]
LYTLLEGTVAGDAAGTLRINAFDINTEAYTGQQWRYKLDAAGTNIGDMTAINDHELLVIERNGATATGGGTPFKKIFKIDLNQLDGSGNVSKTEVVDLMNITDPHDLNGDGSNRFTFPFVTIESVLVLDAHTLLVANDNNYPGIGGRDLGSDNTEFLKIHLDQALNVSPVPEPASLALMVGGLGFMGLKLRRRKHGA